VTNSTIAAEDIAAALDVLEKLADDRGLLLHAPQSVQDRLLRAAGRVAHPGRAARRQLTRARRQRRRASDEDHAHRDERILATTGIRRRDRQLLLRGAAAPQPFDAPQPPHMDVDPAEFHGPLHAPRNCYICKHDYDLVHHFYDALCPNCAQFNWIKRVQSTDLQDRYALVTGGRVKIGFQTALKLLRAGAHVVVTSRFPSDASQRFTRVDDSEQWTDRLRIYGVDLRHTPSVEVLAEHLCETLPQLDFLINNACQTVRRPPDYYAHLIAAEADRQTLDDRGQRLLAAHDELLGRRTCSDRAALTASLGESLTGLENAAELSQVPLAPGDEQHDEEAFPRGQLDEDLQQLDLRPQNSWRLRLADVSTVELFEVHLVNAIAPFVLNARLKPLMLRTDNRDKQIVNVSAMEGVFYRAFKRDTHPHTNMAKAALNMMTRTSAADYVKHGIHMNSVDTGWITDEDPAEIAHRKQVELGFHPPLDQIDAAARICDPIFSGIHTGEHVWGAFLKDYQVANW
jgi:NAD(P)-dependent dehydrogenase (short-subunit alcohol dehydrogenase family)